MNQNKNSLSVKVGKILTTTGVEVDLSEPEAHMFSIKDIAIGLSNICRFGGQLHRFYSVAQHSMLVAHLAPPHLRKAAMLHDASEAYLGDVVKPLKLLLGSVYAELEDEMMHQIGLCFEVTEDELYDVKRYDKEAVEIEHYYLRIRREEEIPAELKYVLYSMPVEIVRQQFIGLYDSYTKVR